MIKENIVFCICDFETTGTDPRYDYPIEIGCIFTDFKFNELGRYESLIKWPRDILLETIDNETTIKREHLSALMVHKIDHEELYKKAKSPNVVISDLFHLVNKYKPKPWGRVILLSDNIHFEWDFMQKLFGERLKVDSLFNYAGWDVNFALAIAGIERPTTNKAHRALADCEGLLLALQELRDTRVIIKKGNN